MDWREDYRNALLNATSNTHIISKIAKSHIPPKLYKYGSFQSEYWRETLYKAKIHLSPANVFNDPFDCRARFNQKEVIRKGLFREKLLSIFSKEDIESLPEEIVQNYIVEEMRKVVYVFCFSEVWNSLLMWAHYANNYNGYCIEYDMSQASDLVKYNLYPVLYEKEYIDLTENLANLKADTGFLCNLVKAVDWQYEKEWRIIKYNDNPFYLRPALKAVYLGKNCLSENKKEILDWAKDNGKNVFDIGISKTRYDLEAQKIL